MLADIMKESDSYYQPKKDLYNQQLSQTDPQQQAEVQGLQQQQQDTFSQIRDQAQRRGLFFSGIPIAEQARYTGSQFLPAVANLQSKYTQQRTGLQGALADLGQQQYSDAMGIQQKQIDREFQAEQGRLAREASAAGSGQFNFGGNNTPTITPTNTAGVLGTQDIPLRVPGNPASGYAFKDAKGTSISALEYSQAHQIPFTQLLQQMANAGDTGAKAGLSFIGIDGNADPTKVTTQQQADLYHSLTGRYVGIYNTPKVQLPMSPPMRTPAPYAPGQIPGATFRSL